MNQLTQKWDMSGPSKVLVERSSAIQGASHKSDILPINRSHSDMVKFREGIVDYQLVADRIYGLVILVSNQLRNHERTGTAIPFPQSASEPFSEDTDSLDHGESIYMWSNL